MKLDQSHLWPPGSRQIEVRHVVIHYTAEPLEQTLRLFDRPERDVGAHLLIGPAGEAFEIAPFSSGSAAFAPHAGKSSWTDSAGREWTAFNEHSLGIELVSPNGNVFDYSEAQYQTLSSAIRLMRDLYPAIDSPERILGHEQIAGWRGKVDPGARFDWPRLNREVFPGTTAPVREPACPPALVRALDRFVSAEPPDPSMAAEHWRAVNYFLEHVVAHLHADRDPR